PLKSAANPDHCGFWLLRPVIGSTRRPPAAVGSRRRLASRKPRASEILDGVRRISNLSTPSECFGTRLTEFCRSRLLEPTERRTRETDRAAKKRKVAIVPPTGCEPQDV